MGNTYKEKKITSTSRQDADRNAEQSERGHPPSLQSSYQVEHPFHSTRHHIVRTSKTQYHHGHNWALDNESIKRRCIRHILCKFIGAVETLASIRGFKKTWADLA